MPHRAISVKRFTLSLFLGVAITALSCVPALSSPPNLTGTWTVQQTGENGSTTSTVTLTQSGTGLVGNNAKNGNGFTGTFVTDGQINGKWHGPGGAGWLTVYVSPNGHSMNGSWGYNGRKENGTFVANKILPPSPVTAAGRWHVIGAGGPAAFVGTMSCKQSGPSALCHVGNVIINGKFRTKDKVRATWNNGSKSGWFSFWFNDDNNSLQRLSGASDRIQPSL